MEDDEFEWDDAKARSNKAKHGIAFDIAVEALRDPLSVSWFDDREAYGEDRFILIGWVRGTYVYVAFMIRGERTRIIMARRAKSYERRIYDKANR